jgi:acetylornithine/succinyldiaminopimelate/putrescine aminotransferase
LAGFELLLEMTGGGWIDDRVKMTDDRGEMAAEVVNMTNDKGEKTGQSLSSVNYHLSSIHSKVQLFRTLLLHPSILSVRSSGLLMAVQLENADICVKVCHECVNAGIVTDWFLFAPNCLRIAPPLIINGRSNP